MISVGVFPQQAHVLRRLYKGNELRRNELRNLGFTVEQRRDAAFSLLMDAEDHFVGVVWSNFRMPGDLLVSD